MENTEARKRFDEQFVRSHRPVFRYVAALVPNREDAEEVFQDTCLKILEKWQDYDLARPMIPWACGIARNMALKFHERSRRRGYPMSEATLAAVSEAQHRMASEVDRRLQQLPGCLEKLTEEQRLLLRQCYGARGSVREVAASRQLEPDAVYKRLERIRRNLFECIERAMAKEHGV